VINTEQGPNCGLATGDPDERAFDLGASFHLSLSLFLSVIFLSFAKIHLLLINFYITLFNALF
jgi:hypothetical protein